MFATTAMAIPVRIWYLLAHIISHYVANHLCNTSRIPTMKLFFISSTKKIRRLYAYQGYISSFQIACVCNHGPVNFSCKKERTYFFQQQTIFHLHDQTGSSFRLIETLTDIERFFSLFLMQYLIRPLLP